MIKKILVTSMCIALLSNLTVFAANGETVSEAGDHAEIPVSGVYEAEHKADKVISVDVKWDAMQFIYAGTSEGSWNPNTHSYDNVTDSAGWLSETKTIEVANHSNTEVSVSMTFEKDASVTGTLTGSFLESNGTANDGILLLASAAEGDSLEHPENAPQASAEFGVSGDAIASETKLGVITVAITRKTVTGISIPVTDEGKYEYWYEYSEGSSPRWERADFLVTYSDGSTGYIDAATEGVTLTPQEDDITVSPETKIYTYTITYEGQSCEFTIDAYSKSSGRLPMSYCIRVL